jgi:Zinc carboxypeptidase
MVLHQIRRIFLSLVLYGLILAPVWAQKKDRKKNADDLKSRIPSPQSVLGFHPTDDKTIADWSQITNYFAKLDAASDRVKVETLGQTTLGKPFIVAFISSEENIKNLDKYKEINARLADPRQTKDPAEADGLVHRGKTVVAISCSIHSTEIVASQMSVNLAYDLATASDPDTKAILQNTILILIPSPNPDGIDIVADWYRKTLGTFYEGSNPPELYHFYAGHDDNRDWFMMNLIETRLVTKLFWKEWFPEIVYDIHQQGQNGTRFIIPPFFDPPNPDIPPLVLRETGLLGYKIAADLQAAGFAGVATNTTYDTWWHGGFRSAPYFHNSIGILSEAASAGLMTPVSITEDKMKNQRVRGLNSPLDYTTAQPMPWRPTVWGPREIADMETVACRSVLEMASKFRENYLRNFTGLNAESSRTGANSSQPLAYVIFAGQGNEEVVSRFIEILLLQGIEVYKMNRELKTSIAGSAEVHTEIPRGSFLVFLDQPQRNNVQALFSKQIYPNRVDEKGSVDQPYDVAGWTLPLQMGVETYAVTQIIEYPNSARRLEKITDVNNVRKTLNLNPQKEPFQKFDNPLKQNVRIGVYKGSAGSMDEGWTRWLLDSFQIPFRSVSDADVRAGKFESDTIILPSESTRQIVDGLNEKDYPTELTGGMTAAGIENLKHFVETGGKLICFDQSCGVVIDRFRLPIKNVLSGLRPNEFYCPGSILQLNVDTSNALARGLKKQTAAYFINSSAFEITDPAVKSVAVYAPQNALLSGWLLGEKYLNGKTALAEASYGKGKIILFGFRPQHRGQSFATFPFIFNALEKQPGS